MKTDIEIANEIEMKPIIEIASKLHIEDNIEQYGKISTLLYIKKSYTINIKTWLEKRKYMEIYEKQVPDVVIKRLPRYYRYLSELLKMDIKRITWDTEKFLLKEDNKIWKEPDIFMSINFTI